MAEQHIPFPNSLDHQLRQLAEMFGHNAKSETEQEDAVYTLRKALAIAYAAGHQEGYLQGRTERYLVKSSFKQKDQN